MWYIFKLMNKCLFNLWLFGNFYIFLVVSNRSFLHILIWIKYLWRSISRYNKSGKIACLVLQPFVITNSKAFVTTILKSTLASGVKILHTHNVIIVQQKELQIDKKWKRLFHSQNRFLLTILYRIGSV